MSFARDALAILLLASSLAHALPGDLDSSFGSGGMVQIPNGTGWNLDLTPSAPEGDFVLAGTSGIKKFRADGSADSTFGSGGVVTLPSGLLMDNFNQMRVDSGGRIVVLTRNYPVQDTTVILRYLANGSPDSSFGMGGQVSLAGLPVWLTLQSDGKILVTGSLSTSVTATVTRLLTNGSVDSSFAGGQLQLPSMGVGAIAQQPDGKLLLLVNVTPLPFQSHVVVRRLNADGTLDTGFGTGGDASIPFMPGAYLEPSHATTLPLNVLVQSDGKILAVAAGGSYTDQTTYREKVVIARLLTDGSVDASYGADGVVLYEGSAAAAALEPDDSLIIGIFGSGSGQPWHLRRVTTDGVADSEYGTCGSSDDIVRPAFNLARQSDGKVVVLYNIGVPVDFAVGRLETGANDVSADPDADSDGVPDACDSCPNDADARQPDRDGDGIGDACDPCTQLGERLPLEGAKIKVDHIDTPAGDETLLLLGKSFVPTTPPIDPTSTGVRVFVGETANFYANPVMALDVTIPGGAYDSVSKIGWIENSAHTAFRYKNAAGLMGITRVVVKVGRGARPITKVLVKGKNLALPGFPSGDDFTTQMGVVQLRPGSVNQCAYIDYMACIGFSTPSKVFCKKLF